MNQEKKDKVTYRTKKRAVSILNFWQKNSSNKKRPMRVYESEDGWHLTKIELIDNVSLIELIASAIKYSDSKKCGQCAMYKKDWENEKKFREFLKNQLKIFSNVKSKNKIRRRARNPDRTDIC